MQAAGLFSLEESRLLIAPDIDPVKKFVTSALENIKEDPFHYRHLVSQLVSRDDPETCWKVLIALAGHVSRITSNPKLYNDLFDAIFTLNWRIDWRVRIALVNLVHHIVSANTTFLVTAFKLIIKTFTLASKTTSQEESSSTVVFNDYLNCTNDLHSLLHRALRSLLTLVPSGHALLFPILEKHFPYKLDSSDDHRRYVTHLLVICQYLPMQQAKLLELIVVRCLEIDVEIHIEDSGEVKIASEESIYDDPSQVMFGIEGGGSSSSAAAASNSLNEVNEWAQKLDEMLYLLIRFAEDKITEAGGRDRLTSQILAIFAEHVLMVHKSKFVQFLVFFLAANDSKFAETFPKSLLSIFMDNKTSPFKRQSAVIYLGSYLARANFVPASFVAWTVDELLRWAFNYVNSAEGSLGISVLEKFASNKNNGNQTAAASLFEYDDVGRLVPKDMSLSAQLTRHGTLLCCVQVLSYLLCFHGSDLIDAQKNSSAKMKWECVLTCSLSPLKHCAPSIRCEFYRLLKHIPFAGDDLWEHLPEEKLLTSGGAAADLTAFYRINSTVPSQSVLESFFPFDPCLLAALSQKIDPYYREWRGIPGIDIALAEETSEETIDEDDEEAEEADDDDEVASSLMSMSVSSMHERPGTRSSSFAVSIGSDVSAWGAALESAETETARAEWRRNAQRPRQYSITSGDGPDQPITVSEYA